MTEPHYSDANVTLLHGDCLDILPTLPDCSVDAVVTDPPYGLEFMGKTWDGADGFRRSLNRNDVDRPNVFGRTSRTSPEYRALHTFQQWCEQWAAECLRVLKPGGHLLAFGGTRTWHRLVCAIEDAGFEIRDSIAWLYGSGFPKSRDVSKDIDKAGGDPLAFRAFARAYAAAVEASPLTHADIDRHLGIKASSCYWAREDHRGGMPPRHHWEATRALLSLSDEYERLYDEAEREVIGQRSTGIGTGRGSVAYIADSENRDLTAPATDAARQWSGWGTALKPAHEPIVVARKPLAGTVAANVLEWGCGALNIDGTRIGSPCGSTEGGGGEAGGQRCSIHGLPSLRNSDAQSAITSGASQAAGYVQQSVSLGDDVPTEELALQRRPVAGQAQRLRPLGDGPHVGGGQGATSQSEPARGSRASNGHGAGNRPPIEDGGDGPSCEWDQGRQQDRESAPDGLGVTLSGASSDRTGTDATASGERTTAGCTCRGSGRVGEPSAERRYTERGGTNFAATPGPRGGSPSGRWPANVVLDSDSAELLDQQSGEVSFNPAGQFGVTKTTGSDIYGNGKGIARSGLPVSGYGDRGGASRFFYTSKADSTERPTHNGIAHPTVKPLDLMRWLVRLVTPPGGTVLEPFAGSGTTVEAALLEGLRCIAIEREADYLPLILQRIHRRRDPVAYLTNKGEDLGLFEEPA